MCGIPYLSNIHMLSCILKTKEMGGLGWWN